MVICDGVEEWRRGVEKWCEDWGLKGDQYYKGQGVFETGVGWGLLGALLVMVGQQQRQVRQERHD